MNQTLPKLPFILIDDSPLDLKINERLLLHGQMALEIKKFDQGRLALQSLHQQIQQYPLTIILLDIQMPDMNGFDWLEAFSALPDATQQAFAIFMLSSTLDESDFNKVWQHPRVLALLPKPLELALLQMHLKELLTD